MLLKSIKEKFAVFAVSTLIAMAGGAGLKLMKGDCQSVFNEGACGPAPIAKIATEAGMMGIAGAHVGLFFALGDGRRREP